METAGYGFDREKENEQLFHVSPVTTCPSLSWITLVTRELQGGVERQRKCMVSVRVRDGGRER